MAVLVLPSLEKIVLLRLSFCGLTGSLETAADAPPGLLIAVLDSCLPIPEAFLLGSWINLILLGSQILCRTLKCTTMLSNRRSLEVKCAGVGPWRGVRTLHLSTFLLGSFWSVTMHHHSAYSPHRVTRC